MKAAFLLPGLSLALGAAAPLPGLPTVQQFKLPNGLSVSLVERHDRPLVRAELRVAWPAELEIAPATLTALQRMLGLREGGPHDAEAFTRAVEDAGASLGFQASFRAFTWQMLAPSAEADVALDLLAHRMLHPRLDPGGVERVRRELRRNLSEANLEARAKDRFFGLLGAPAPLAGAAEESLDRLNLESLLEAHRSLVDPTRAHLVLHGDLSLEQARQTALLHFGAWGKGASSSPALPRQSTFRGVAALESGPSLEAWVALEGRGAEALGGPRLALLGAALQRLWKRPPAPFEHLDCVAGGEQGLLVLRFRAPASTATLEAVAALRLALERIRTEGLPGALWGELGYEAQATCIAERLHPAAWVARLARQEASVEAIADPAPERLNAQLRTLLADSNLTYLILGADARSRSGLEAAGLKPLLWMTR